MTPTRQWWPRAGLTWAIMVLLLSHIGPEDVASAGCPADPPAPTARGDVALQFGAPGAGSPADALMRLEVVGHVGGSVVGLDCGGGRCYAAAGDRIGVFDVSDPSRPTVLGETGLLPAAPVRIAEAGDRAYALMRTGLAIVEASDPMQPRVAGWVSGDPLALQPGAELEAHGSHAFVAGADPSDAAHGGRLVIVDAADPEQPIVVAELALPGVVSNPGLCVDGSRAYLASGASGVRVVDVSDVARPELVGTVPSEGARDCVAEGDRLYVADRSGISVHDVTKAAGPRLLGRWIGSPFDDLSLVADRVWLFHPGWGALVIDASDPASMVAIGTYLDESALALDAAGETAFVAAGVAGIRTWDTSALRPIGLVGSAVFDAAAQGLTVHGDTGYVAADDLGLRIVDLGDPERPSEVGALDTPGRAMAVAANGRLAFVADGNGGLRVIDALDATAPREVGSWTLGPAMDVDVAGSVACVVGWSGLPQRPEMSVIDVGDPSAPVRVGRVETASYHVFRVRVSGTAAFVLGEPSIIQVFDLSVPSAPREVARIGAPSATDFEVSDGRLYVASALGLVIVDLGDPTAPSTVATVSALGSTDRVAVSGRTVLVSGRAHPDGGRFVRFLDVSDPVHPREAGLVELADHPAPRGAPFTPRGDITDIAMGHGRAYLTTDYLSGSTPARGYVAVLDPATASPARLLAERATVSGRDVAASSHRAYVLGGGSLQVVDVSLPSAPRMLSSLTGLAGGVGVAAEGQAVFVVDSAGLLAVVDASNAALPRVVGSLRVADRANSLAVSNGTAYVAAGAQGLRLVDVRDPSMPTAIGSIGTFWASDVAISSTRALVVGPRHATVLDVGDPSAPVVLGSAATTGAAPADVSLHGELAYVVSRSFEGGQGLLVVDCRDPTGPRMAAELEWPLYSAAVRADRSLPAAVVLDAFAALHLVDVRDPAAPMEVHVVELAAPLRESGPDPAAALDMTEGNLYAVTTHLGLTIARTAAAPITERLYLPMVAAAPRG